MNLRKSRKLKNIHEQWISGGDFCRHFIETLNLDGDIFYIYVYNDEFNDVPLFHATDANTNTDIAICIFEPRMYQYTHSIPKEAPFLPDCFDQALRQKCTTIDPKVDRTVWEEIVYEWLSDRSGLSKKYKGAKQPDYTKLDDNKCIRRSFLRMLIAKWYA